MKAYHELAFVVMFATILGLCVAGENPVVKAGIHVREQLTRKYGKKSETVKPVFRNTQGLELDALFASLGLVNTTVTVMKSNDTEFVRSFVFDSPEVKHDEQVRLLILEGKQSIEIARQGLYEAMGAGMNMRITDSTFRKIDEGIGDESYVLNHPKDLERSNIVNRVIWFRRDNVAVELACSGDKNLLPLARLTDKAIVNLAVE